MESVFPVTHVSWRRFLNDGNRTFGSRRSTTSDTQNISRAEQPTHMELSAFPQQAMEGSFSRPKPTGSALSGPGRRRQYHPNNYWPHPAKIAIRGSCPMDRWCSVRLEIPGNFASGMSIEMAQILVN